VSRTAEAFGIGDEEAALLIGHGSRRERSNEAVRELAAAVETRLGVPTDAAFLELESPSIPDAIAGLAPTVSRLTLVPLSLFAASHVKNDLPLAVNRARSTHPDVRFHAGAHLGIHPAILDVLDDRAAAVEETLGVDRDDDDVAVVVCARGSSDPDSNGDVHKLARLLYEGRSFSRVTAAFIGVTEPPLEDALHELTKSRPDAIAVLPYMLGDGVLTGRIRDGAADFDDAYPYVDVTASDPLGTDSRLIDVLADRWQEARSGTVAMSCDTCKYKVELDGYEEDEGGARAMLRALTHQQAHEDRDGVAAEPHAHDAPGTHLAVCTNQTCAANGSPAVLETLRQATRDADADIHITRSSCLNQCGDGPIVAQYPAGVWYGGCTADDASRIVSAASRDRVVSDLVHQTL